MFLNCHLRRNIEYLFYFLSSKPRPPTTNSAPSDNRIVLSLPETDYVSELPSAKKHRVPILGLYPGMQNQVLIELLDDYNQTLASHTIPIDTKNLPGYMRDCIIVKKKPEKPAFPFILINLHRDFVLHTYGQT